MAERVTDFKECARLAQNLGILSSDTSQKSDMVTEMTSADPTLSARLARYLGISSQKSTFVAEIRSADPTLSPQTVAFEIVVAWASSSNGISAELLRAWNGCFGWMFHDRWLFNKSSEDGKLVAYFLKCTGMHVYVSLL